MKKHKPIWITVCAFILLALALLLINEIINQRVFVTKYTYKNSEVPKSFEGYKILMISDLHEAPFSDQISDYINELSPDLIVFTGDMVQLPDATLTETLKIAGEVKDIPMYAVTGNHETQGGHYDEIIETLYRNNIIPLDNDSVCIERGEDSILLLGIKDPVFNEVSHEQIKEIKEQIESEFPNGPTFSVLLSHRADLYPDIKDTDVDLILSGHLHGGVVRLPLIGGVFGKGEDRWFSEYEYGLYEDENGADMIVSGGCDKNPKKKRYFDPPEIVLITLEREDG